MKTLSSGSMLDTFFVASESLRAAGRMKMISYVGAIWICPLEMVAVQILK